MAKSACQRLPLRRIPEISTTDHPGAQTPLRLLKAPAEDAAEGHTSPISSNTSMTSARSDFACVLFSAETG